MKKPTRREMLEMAAAAALLSGHPKDAVAATIQAAPTDTLRFFPGFQAKRVKTSGAEVNLVHAGSGPPLLLMHGAPQTHVSMRLIAPELAKDYTVGRSGHRTDALSLYARHHRVRPGLLPLVQLPAAGPGTRERSEDAVRGA